MLWGSPLANLGPWSHFEEKRQAACVDMETINGRLSHAGSRVGSFSTLAHSRGKRGAGRKGTNPGDGHHTKFFWAP
jgi:hypothetical protein